MVYNIMLIYPPGRAFQRGEDRCQIDIESSLVNCNRACNDLGYMSACLKRNGYNTFIRDYQAEKSDLNDLFQDIRTNNPDVLCISTTNGSIFDDLNILKEIKNIKKDIVTILKGALFFNPNIKFLNETDFSNADYLIGGEVEFIIEKLVNAHFYNKSELKDIQGICYKKDNEWIINELTEFNDDLDSLPFPDRALMKNELYINPETNKPMALITTSKGCCFNCSYCLSPVISGKKVRFRSTESIFAEIKECIEKYNITNFFFKADTYTTDKKRVIELCNLIINSGINKKINWTATSRVDTLDEELIKIMKKAGCSLLALGFESGSQTSLDNMKKHTTTAQNIQTAKLCKKYGIKILGYFLIGFPWENESHLKETEKHIFKIDADYIEISIVIPYYKTPLYDEIFKDKNGDDIDILGHDSYKNIVDNVSKLSIKELKNFKKNIALKFYLRPVYIIKCLKRIKSFHIFRNYVYYGLRMVKNSLLK